VVILVGALIGFIGTRFMEDGNLLVSSIFVLLVIIIVLSIWLMARKLARL
jgi:hypothetical protein